MKYLHLITTAALMCAPIAARGAAVTIDPTLCGTIIGQTTALQDAYKTRSKHYITIEAMQAGIAVSLNAIHTVEEHMINCLANASGVMQNAHDLVKIAQLVGIDIPNNLIELGKDIPQNLKGTAINMFVNSTIADTTADIVSLSQLVEKLVKSHYTFQYSKDKEKIQNGEINLLSAAERYSIMHSVLARLNSINRRLWLTKYYIRTFTWKHLWMGLDRKSWCQAVYGQTIATRLINQWKNFKF